MLAKSLAKCPFWKNSSANSFRSGASSIDTAKSLCPFVKKNYSSISIDDLQQRVNNVEETTHQAPKPKAPSKCPFLKENPKFNQEATKAEPINYNARALDAVTTLKEENRYRTFIDVKRHKGSYPRATRRISEEKSEELTVWCSNDYLGMGQHPKVIRSMMKSIEESGAGAGGTRNIGGNTKYIVDLEKELASFHNKDRAMVSSSCYVVNEAVLSTLP